MNVLFFGGSFDPPHVAHVLCAAYALCVGDFQRVLVVPVFEHAFGKQLCPFADRLRMCQLAFAPLQGVTVSGLEAELDRPSYTLNTLEHIERRHPDYKLRLLLGSDVLSDTEKWYRFEDVVRVAPPFVVPRAGFSRPGELSPLPEVSSTDVRDLLGRRADPAAAEALTGLLPRAVLEHIDAQGLYR
jgi:nicotinate-nucleotide adenylyltransferase